MTNTNKEVNIEKVLMGIYIESPRKMELEGEAYVCKKDGIKMIGRGLVQKIENVMKNDKVYTLYNFVDLKIDHC
jgi:hypothetical protein